MNIIDNIIDEHKLKYSENGLAKTKQTNKKKRSIMDRAESI